MINVFRAELSKFTHLRTVLLTIAAITLVAVVATAVVFSIAEPERGAGFSGPTDGIVQPTVEELAAPGGGSEAFSFAVSFTGIFVFVVFTANWASEFSRATVRTLLLAQPRRELVLGGKLGGLLAYAAVALALGLIVAWIAGVAMAPAAGISSDAWFNGSALLEHGRAYVNALIGIVAWGCFGMALGVLVRSIPIALAIGIIWTGPFENITQESWNAAGGIYPGLLLRALAAGGTDDVAYARALFITLVYVGLAVLAATIAFRRRDIVN